MKPLTDRTAPRFFVPLTLSPGAEIELPERAARHVAVLRLHGGDALTLFNGAGGECAAELTRVSKDTARARIVSASAVERESPLAVRLALCISGGERMDVALQKATELGVAAVAPLASERSVVKLAGERAERRLAHWRNVVIAACEQCGRNRVPEVAEIAVLDDFLAGTAGDGLRLLLAPDAATDLKSLGRAGVATLLIGPEGGLSPQERGRAESRGFVPVRFGPRVLRTETAPLAALAAMQALWGDC